ncbi:beta-N-acetylhexosaminidase [Marihabitans asiaticum]|uniref:beta-N-acetylhexosaminidase n=1 Tax=Marihabitans asiaticum TaxID=415218 RepID=A0A560WCZ9_9MICO|nr:beta-N-acetylhexosaminidase [Marihabitans asiaticum]
MDAVTSPLRSLPLGAVLALAACSGSTPAAETPSSSSAPSPSAAESSTSTQAQGPSECVSSVSEAMTPEQRAGQLLMVALTPQMGQDGLDAQLADGLGNMLYLGGWEGRSRVAEASAHLQEGAPTVDGTTIGMLIAADQEGGEVQQLTGEGFSTIPSGVEQGGLGSEELIASALTWGNELGAAGVNVNLAPTADTVPEEIGKSNAPIGQYGRQYGSTPAAAGQGAASFAAGMHAAGVMPTAKHFPGIGRITGNTDATAEGITDEEASTDDPHLAPFATVIKAAPTLVMVGSARYPQIDEANQAPFSEAIVTDLLREQLGFDGVVITDDVGVAKAVADVPVAERATRFLAAGGDIVLTADATQTATMQGAIVDRAKGDEEFAGKVEDSLTRVLTLKESMGLLRCG